MPAALIQQLIQPLERRLSLTLLSILQGWKVIIRSGQRQAFSTAMFYWQASLTRAALSVGSAPIYAASVRLHANNALQITAIQTQPLNEQFDVTGELSLVQWHTSPHLQYPALYPGKLQPPLVIAKLLS